MTWHVLAQVGPSDDYVAELGPDEPRISVGIARPGDRWEINNDVLETIFERTGRFPSAPALDLLHLALSVYSADLEIPRSLFQSGWARDLTLHLPVSDPDLWNEMSPLIIRLLAFLTGDDWHLNLRQAKPFVPPKPIRPKPPTLTRSVDRVALFSGGLDSLAGAIDFLEKGETVALTGHYGKGKTNGIQRQVFESLTKTYGERAVDFMFYAQPPKQKRKGKKQTDGEQSMRSRSLLFLSIGINVAATLGPSHPLTVSENGLISLNVPLTNSRIGSLSTRTTHPHFLGLLREVLRGLGLHHELQTPYRYQTKGEMIARSSNRAVLADSAKLSMSCSHPEAGRFQGRAQGNHCGYCVPCLIRRASMNAAGFDDAPYDIDVLTHPPDVSTETGEDLRAFEMALERFAASRPHEALFRVLSTGSLPPEDAAEYAAVYSRGMEELGRLLMPERFHEKQQT
jgi:7-cyano-7-deazaguanine synthase in queuosine biosynthesis